MVKIINTMQKSGIELDVEIFGSPDIVMQELIIGVNEVLRAMAKDMGKEKRELEALFVEEFIDSTRK